MFSNYDAGKGKGTQMKRVMVVDDSRFVCDEIRHTLVGSGFEVVHTCRDAEEAFQGYQSCQPDIVIMDIILPGIDGIEATGAMLAKWPEARIVIVSSLAYDDTISRARKMGAKSFLFKPFDRDMLLQALEQALEQELEPAADQGPPAD